MNKPIPAPDCDDRRVDSMWKSSAPKVLIRERRKRARRRVAFAASVAVVGVLGVLAGRWQASRPSEVSTGQVDLVANDAPTHFQLSDGSTLRIDARTVLTVDRLEAGAIDVTLRSGKANFDVTKNRQRSFRVHVDDVVVAVVGTRFSLERRGLRAEVEVEEGVVEVHAGGSTRRLSAHERWSGPTVYRSGPEDAAGSSQTDVVGGAVLSALDAGAASVRAETYRSAATEERAAARRARLLALNADAMFRLALEARGTGDTAIARDAFATFLERFPSDSRAALAQFELGRIEMDFAHDYEAAIDVLSRAVSGAQPGAPFLEDAFARLVRAHHARGDLRGCTEARSAYGRRFPNGAYAKALESLCR